VDLEARMALQPAFYRAGLMSAVIVHHQVQFQLRSVLGINLTWEAVVVAFFMCLSVSGAAPLTFVLPCCSPLLGWKAAFALSACPAVIPPIAVVEPFHATNGSTRSAISSSMLQTFGASYRHSSRAGPGCTSAPSISAYTKWLFSSGSIFVAHCLRVALSPF
jgi:hypothetical protein